MSDKPAKNRPCPCGSGKKYKRCCISDEEAAQKPGKKKNPAIEFSEDWEKREVRRWMEWKKQGLVSTEPPWPIKQYADRHHFPTLTEQHAQESEERSKRAKGTLMAMQTMANFYKSERGDLRWGNLGVSEPDQIS